MIEETPLPPGRPAARAAIRVAFVPSPPQMRCRGAPGLGKTRGPSAETPLAFCRPRPHLSRMPLNPTVCLNNLVLCRDTFTWGDWLSVLGLVGQGVGANNLSKQAAGIAFIAMQAQFPGIAATVSLYGYFANPADVLDNLGLLAPILPDEVHGLVDARVAFLITEGRQSLGLASIVNVALASWSARAGINALVSALNTICRERNTRNVIWGMIVSYSLTLLMIAVVLVTLSMLVVVPVVLAVAEAEPLSDLLRWAIAVSAVTLGIGALYRFGPSRRRPLPFFTIGTFLAATLWIGMSYGFSLYLGSFSNYGEVYGPLGAVITALMWFYLSAFVVLLGAEVNAEVETHAIDIIRTRYPHLLLHNDPLMREMTGVPFHR